MDSVAIYYDNEPAPEYGFTMRPRWNGPGETLTISAQVFPQTIPNIAAGVTWSSSDESVITCTPSEDNPLVCTLTQVGNGNCIITCTVYGVSATLPMSAYDLPEE